MQCATTIESLNVKDVTSCTANIFWDVWAQGIPCNNEEKELHYTYNYSHSWNL